MSIDEIVAVAHAEAENRVDETKLDLRLQLHLAIQELLHENRFWWAERTGRFTTSAGVATYDLSASGLSNTNDVEEILTVYNVNSATTPKELDPLLTRTDQIAALEAVTAAEPSSWMMDLGNWPTLRLGAPANGAFPLRFIYHAGLNIPNAVDGSVAPPYVPAPLQYGLIIALKRRIFSFLYGQNDPRFIVANAEYLKFVKDAARKRSFSAQHMNTWDSGAAVRAHH